MVEEDKNMEFMKIGNNSLKITMNAKEAKGYDLIEGATLEGEEVKRTFEKLLLRAKREIGYKYAGQKVVAEIFSSKNGGCEIFLSYAEESMYKDVTPKETTKKPPKSITNIFALDCLEDLITVAFGLESANYKGKSSVYYDDVREGYYIILDDVSVKEEKYSFISEFARYIKNSNIAYLKEHCKCLANKNAVKLFATLK